MVLLKNLRDVCQVAILGRQLHPGKSKGFLKAYEDALSEKHGYFLVDMSPKADNRYRLRTYFPRGRPCGLQNDERVLQTWTPAHHLQNVETLILQKKLSSSGKM